MNSDDHIEWTTIKVGKTGEVWFRPISPNILAKMPSPDDEIHPPFPDIWLGILLSLPFWFVITAAVVYLFTR